jgi:integrase
MASITKVTGGYRARWRTPDGASRSKTFARKLDADRHLTSIEHTKLTGTYVDPRAGRVTVADYAAGWQASRVHRASSAERLDVYLRRHVLPHLGARPIGSLRHSEVQAWVRRLSEDLAPGTVESVFRGLSGMMRSAVRDRIITANPCDDVVLPRRPKCEVIPPTVDEVATLLGAMPERYRILGVLAAGAGLRQGEALGLTVDRVDFLRRSLRVDRQLVTLVGQAPTWAPPKSEASVRTVPLADVVLDELSAHLATFPAGPDGLVCTYQDGGPIKRNRFGAMWRQSVARAGLERSFRYHDLRHHFASALIAGNCSIKAVQHALGHASAKETLDTYAHLWPDSDDLTREAINTAWQLGTTCEASLSPRPSSSGRRESTWYVPRPSLNPPSSSGHPGRASSAT